MLKLFEVSLILFFGENVKKTDKKLIQFAPANFRTKFLQKLFE